MVVQALVQIGRHSDIEATFLVLNNVDPRHTASQNLVAGAGFEPAIRQLPDYEPDGGVTPIIR